MTFRLGLTRDLLTPSGAPSFGMGALEVLNHQSDIEWEYLPESLSEITPDVADGPASAILDQVTHGLAVRMAVLARLVR